MNEWILLADAKPAEGPLWVSIKDEYDNRSTKRAVYYANRFKSSVNDEDLTSEVEAWMPFVAPSPYQPPLKPELAIHCSLYFKNDEGYAKEHAQRDALHYLEEISESFDCDYQLYEAETRDI